MLLSQPVKFTICGERLEILWSLGETTTTIQWTFLYIILYWNSLSQHFSDNINPGMRVHVNETSLSLLWFMRILNTGTYIKTVSTLFFCTVSHLGSVSVFWIDSELEKDMDSSRSATLYQYLVKKKTFLLTERNWNTHIIVCDWPPFRTRWKATGETVRLATCLPPRLSADLQLNDRYPEAAPGTAVFIRKDKRTRQLCVRCREGWLAVDNIYYGQKKVMSPADFYNGFLSKGKDQMFVSDSSAIPSKNE